MEALSVYIPIDRRQAMARGKELPDRTRGAALFADISGFTPLTEALVRELGPQRGADELTRQLNRVYNALIAEVHHYGGSVIGFSGDAITCWFDDDPSAASGQAGLWATACGLAMQGAMGQFATIETPSGGLTVSLAMKAAVATGTTLRPYLLELVESDESASDLASIEIADADLCSRYVGRVVRGVRIMESPAWLQQRLQICGVRPINAVVDATNYLLLSAFHLQQELSPLAPFVILVAIHLGALFPTAPAQIGVFHYLCILSLVPFGVESSVALSYGVVLHLVVYLPIAILGSLGLWRERWSVRWDSGTRIIVPS